MHLGLDHLLCFFFYGYPSSHPLVKNIAVFNITKKRRCTRFFFFRFHFESAIAWMYLFSSLFWETRALNRGGFLFSFDYEVVTHRLAVYCLIYAFIRGILRGTIKSSNTINKLGDTWSLSSRSEIQHRTRDRSSQSNLADRRIITITQKHQIHDSITDVLSRNRFISGTRLYCYLIINIYGRSETQRDDVKKQSSCVHSHEISRHAWNVSKYYYSLFYEWIFSILWTQFSVAYSDIDDFTKQRKKRGRWECFFFIFIHKKCSYQIEKAIFFFLFFFWLKDMQKDVSFFSGEIVAGLR